MVDAATQRGILLRLRPWIIWGLVLLVGVFVFHRWERARVVEHVKDHVQRLGNVWVERPDGTRFPPGTAPDILKNADLPFPGWPWGTSCWRRYPLVLFACGDRLEMVLGRVGPDSDEFRLFMPSPITGRSIEVGMGTLPSEQWRTLAELSLTAR